MRFVFAAALAALASTAFAQSPAYVQPPNYAQLRADCADDSDVARQIAGCEAVLANPGEQNNYAIATNNRGHARERSGDLAAALADYERAVAIDPGYADAHLNRGAVLARLGRADEAIAAFDRSIAIADGGWARLERGRILARRNERDRALADFEAAARFLPGDDEVLSERDWARVRHMDGYDFDELAPPPATLAEAVLSAEGFSGILSREDAARLSRDGQNRARLDSSTMVLTGGPGRYEVEARSCSEVIYSEITEQPGGPHVDRRVIDLDRLRTLLRREGDDLVYAEGPYGQRTLQTARGPLTVALNTRPGAQPRNESWFRQALAYLDAIRRFCPGTGTATAQAAQAQPPAQAAPPPSAPPAARDPIEAAVVGPPARAYVGDALFRAPIGPLPSGDALLAYTRDLLAPAFPGLTLSPLSASNALAFRGEAQGLASLTLRWWDLQGAGTAQIQMSQFERELNGGCVNQGVMGQRGGQDTRVILYTAACPATDPPYLLGWLAAFDRERSRLLLVATPAANGAAMQAAGGRMLAALGMSAGASAAQPAPPPEPRPDPASRTAAPSGVDFGALAEAFLAEYLLSIESPVGPEQRRLITRTGPNTARIVQPPRPGWTGFVSEVEARSCTEVIARNGTPGAPRPFDTVSTYDLPAWARIMVREGRNIRLLPGPYGRRVDHVQNGASWQMTQENPRLMQPDMIYFGGYDRLLRVIDRFCRGREPTSGAAATPPVGTPAPGPDLAALAEGFLADHLLAGAMTPEQRRQIERPRPNVVRFVNPAGPRDAGFVAEVEARSCAEVVWRDGIPGGPRPFNVESIYDLPAYARILVREGDGIRLLAGDYGRRRDLAAGGAGTTMTQSPQLLRRSDADHVAFDGLLRLVERHCGGAGAAAASVGSSIAGAQGTVQVETVRGLLRDRPYTYRYPSELTDRPGANADVSIGDAAGEFEATLTIQPATPSLSAEFDQRSLGGPGFLDTLRRFTPGANIVGRALLRLPGGPAYVLHTSAPATVSTPAMREVNLSFYDGGRQYRLAFTVRESAFERWRETIGFIIANFQTTSAASPCCAPPATVP